MNNSSIVAEIYGYLNAANTANIKPANGAFVFGRADPLLAEKISALYASGLVKYAMISGGIGKDSGPLKDLGLSEAAYQAALLRYTYGVPDADLWVETKATNGGENCRLGIATILEKDCICADLIIVAHATSIRRLHAMMLVEAEKLGFYANYQLVPTDYLFDPEKPSDQQEAVAELLRLADWPAKQWAVAQTDLPLDLVAHARNLKT